MHFVQGFALGLVPHSPKRCEVLNKAPAFQSWSPWGCVVLCGFSMWSGKPDKNVSLPSYFNGFLIIS